MGRGFRIFLVSLLGFCVLVGAFCIIWPLVTSQPPTQPTMPPSNSGSQLQVGDPQPDGSQTGDPADPAADPAPPTEDERKALSLLETMTLEEKIYQLFIVTPETITGVATATRAGDATREAIEAYPVGGIVYFADNLIDRAQTTEMLLNTQSYAKIPMFLAVDEEGGIVSRVGSNPALGTTAFSNMADYGEAADPQAVYEIGKTLGAELLELGFNLDFAPVADVVTNPANTEIGPRAFSDDPYVAAKMVGSIVSGMQEESLLCTLKHFPGHGSTSADSHNGISVTDRTLEDLQKAEFLPFLAGIDAGAPLVMVGHLSAPEIVGDNTPADLSKVIVTDILREQLGYRGIVITDAQNMGAITDYYSSAEAAVGALEAGVDVILMPADLQEAADGVLQAVQSGQLTEERINESVVRILAAKYQYGILS